MLPAQKTNTNLGIALGFLMLGIVYFFPRGTFSPTTAQFLGVIGALFYLWGCISYAVGKGHSTLWGFVALIPFFGLIILVALPDNHGESAGPVRSGCTYVTVALLLGFLGLVGWNAFRATFPASVEEATQSALKLYPQLGVPNSPLNREFVARYKKYQISNKDYFKKLDWPLTLAEESQSAINNAPNRR